MIQVRITEYNFEHDLYALVRSFYPGTETRVEILAPPEKTEGGKGEHYVEIDELHIPLPDAEAYTDRLALKSYVKRCVYEELQKQTGKSLAWGTLTGIRPSKLATQMLEEGKREEEILRHLKKEYLVSDGKAALCLEVARTEQRVLSQLDYENGYSVYVGIPFCPTRCLYCSFTSYPISVWEKRVEEYLKALFREIDYVAEIQKQQGKTLDTLYMGGGTPTTLTAEQMDRLLTKLETAFDFDMRRNPDAGSIGKARLIEDGHRNHPLEFTVEAGRPDSITKEKLQVIYDHGVRRISVNPQTMQQKTLDLIGRRHTVEETENAFHMAREVGFTNINMDIIVGLPDETLEDVEDTIRRIRALQPDSLTVHSLAIKRAARLNTMKETYSRYQITNTPEMIDVTEAGARAMDMIPYYMYRQKNMAGNFENVGYAQVDKAGIYNILIMEEKQSIIALGAGGSSKIVLPEGGQIERIENVKDVGQYIARVDEMIERKGEWLCR